MKQRSSRVIKDVHDVCERNRVSLAMVLSNMCAFGDPEAKAIVNEIVEEMAVKRGVKRSVEELVGDDTMSKYVACLRVPDWKLVLFQAMARVSSKTWQSVINITGLGRTGVRCLVTLVLRRAQVLFGIVLRDGAVYSQQSAKSVYPLTIANCKEDRDNLKIHLEDINHQKKILKEKGMIVDGRHYTVEFLVVLDYKTLVLLLVKKTNASFMLGGRGVSVEFCFICNAIRGCKCHDVAPDETCLDCLRSKCNIGRSTGIRDDLVFLLDEELCNIQLCALHMEMRNTEQLLASIGLLAYRVDSLAEANAALKNYGPESFHGDCISVKKKSDQQSAITKQNIHVSSMSGKT
ncbi:unnamed protein product, partial [Pocillopora meandrina]